jgi:hypothetical protein
MAAKSSSGQVSWLLWTVLIILVGGALAGLFAYYGSLTDPAKREAFLGEGGKALVTLVTVGVVGAIIKLLLDDRAYSLKASDEKRMQDEQRQYDERVRADEKEARLQEFRTDKIRRLAGVTNVLRRAPILIAAHQSAKTYNEQMRLIIDAGLELRLIRHETNAIGSKANPAFAEWPRICDRIDVMEQYIENLATEWRLNSKELSERQRRAEAPSLQAEERQRQQFDIWRDISAIKSVSDLLEETGDRESKLKTKFATKFIEPYNSAMGMMINASLVSIRGADKSAAAYHR